jgi:hypothetical protein
MKRKYIDMAMLIQGPKQPRNDINLYLQLLKEELETLWAKEGVNTWEANAQNYFPFEAVLIMATATVPLNKFLGVVLSVMQKPCAS